MLNVDCTALHPPKAGERLLKFRKLAIPSFVVLGGFLQHAYPPHALTRLLRPRRERPCHRQNSSSFNEIASSHCHPQSRNYATPPTGLQQQFATDEMGFGVNLNGSNLE